MKKILITIIVGIIFIFSPYTKNVKAADAKILYQKENIIIKYENNSLILQKEGGNDIIFAKPYDIEGAAVYGMSPNAEYFAYSKNQDLSVYFYDINNERELIITESNDPQLSVNYENIIWSPSSDKNFFIIETNDTLGNIKFCYYENLIEKNCIKNIDGISSKISDTNNFIMPGDYKSVEFTDDNQLVFKKEIANQKNVYEKWTTDIKGENPIRVEILDENANTNNLKDFIFLGIGIVLLTSAITYISIRHKKKSKK